MKKIAFIYTGMNVGGAQLVMLNLIENSREFGFEPIIISDKGILLNNLNEKYKHYTLPLKKKNILSMVFCANAIYKILKSEKINIIHSHHRYTSALCLLLSKILKIKLVHTEHNFFTEKNLINLRGKNIIAVSNNVKQNLLNNNIRDVGVIYNGIKIIEKKRKVRELKCRNLCFIGRLVPEKGIINLINIYYNVLQEIDDLHLYIIGEGVEYEKIKKLVINLKISDKVTLMGHQNEIIDLINEMDVFLMPSKFEGLPITMLEIMSQGKILIANNVGGIGEVIINDFNGYLCDSKDMIDFENKLKNVILNFEYLEKIEINAQNTIKNGFSEKLMIKNYMNYYEKL